MTNTWLEALNRYEYPLRKYDCPVIPSAFFLSHIPGDRPATRAFEDYFRAHAHSEPKVWHEVAFWKLYTQPARWKTVNKIINKVCTMGDASQLWQTTQDFVMLPSEENFVKLRNRLGLESGMAVPLTFVAFAEPNLYAIIDKKVARWINTNFKRHSANRNNQLKGFQVRNDGYVPYSRNNFDSYKRWVYWCREIASILYKKTHIEWRARDVEMAVFNDPDNRLSILP